MAQMGHATPDLTLAIYARCMDRRDGEPHRLKALVEGRELPAGSDDSGTRGVATAAEGTRPRSATL
jgi:hypothetical protein